MPTPKAGRADVAAELEIPASWVWVVRSVAGMLKVTQEQVVKNRLYLKRRGITVKEARTPR